MPAGLVHTCMVLVAQNITMRGPMARTQVSNVVRAARVLGGYGDEWQRANVQAWT